MVVSTDLKSVEAEKLAPQNAPLADALASKVDLYDLVPEIKQNISYFPLRSHSTTMLTRGGRGGSVKSTHLFLQKLFLEIR